jgi:hypothetical protein
MLLLSLLAVPVAALFTDDCARPLPPAPLPKREVVATTFTRVDGGVWCDWTNWDAITTVVDVYRFGNESALACRAHSHGARLLYNFGDKEFLHWGLNRSRDLHNRSAYAGVAAALAASGADGLLVDVESNVAKDPAQQGAARTDFTLFVARLRRALLAANPAAVLAIAATGYPVRPDSNKGAWPHFDLAALANVTDFFFVMAYGTDAFRDNQTAHSNARLSMLRGLVAGYPTLGVPLHHLVLGLPWYGYDNTCVAGTAPDAQSCPRGKSGAELGKAGEFFQELPLVYDARHKDACEPPHRKCGPQSFDRSLHTVLGLLSNRSSPVMYDDHPDEQSPFFNYIDGEGTVHQLWFDSPQSLRLRYDIARKEGLRGVSAWRNDMVDYSGGSAALCTRALWAAMVGAAPPPAGSCPLDVIETRTVGRLQGVLKADDIGPPLARLAVPVAADGSYSVIVDGGTWFESGPTYLRHSGRQYSTHNQSLALMSAAKSDGSGWAATTMQWKTSDGASFITVVNVSVGFAVFTQIFPEAISGASTGDRDSIISAFPNLAMVANETKGVVSFKGAGDYQVHIGNWSAATGIAPPDLITSGIGDTCPTVVFSKDMSTSLVLSAFSNFMAHNQKFGAGDRNPTLAPHPTLAYGVMGAVGDVPAHYTTATIISLGSGISGAMDAWGDRLLSHYGKKSRYDYRRDLATQKLGYATDNGAFYYYNPEPYNNYQQTMTDVKAYAQRVGLPYHYTILDVSLNDIVFADFIICSRSLRNVSQ